MTQDMERVTEAFGDNAEMPEIPVKWPIGRFAAELLVDGTFLVALS